MKKLILTLLVASLASWGISAQQRFDGSEFGSLTSAENAQQFSEYLAAKYQLSADQQHRIYVVRFATAEHLKAVDQSGVQSPEITDKKAKILASDAARVQNVLTREQLSRYQRDLHDEKMRAQRSNAAPAARQ